jgi:predicted amidophosphoribosyltransferase
MKIPGKWLSGYVLDYHTVYSNYCGDDEYGHPVYDTKRTDMGELLYRLKYKGDCSVIDSIIEECVHFLKEIWKPDIDMLTPILPSNTARSFQPVYLLAEKLGEKICVRVDKTVVKKIKDTPQLKGIHDFDARLHCLENAFDMASCDCVKGRKILLFDDLFRSGATMNAVTQILYEKGKAARIYAFAITRTKSSL